MFGRTTFKGITDTDLYDLEQLSVNLTERAKNLERQNTSNEDIQELAAMVTQLGRITTLQTQALRSIR